MLKNKFFKKGVAVVAALGLTAAMLPGAAFASTAGVNDDTTYITAAATRAAGPLPEYLGLAGVEECGEFVDTSDYFNWPLPKYYLDADEDTTYNTAYNPYLYNLATGNVDPDVTAVLNPARFVGGGPDAALGVYGADATDDAVWDLQPTIVIGTNGGGADYDDPGYGLSYSPVGITYTFSYFADLIDTMNATAAAADAAVTATEVLRYGNADAIATAYERYIYGTQGYVLEQLANAGLTQKTVAVVYDYDLDTGYFSIFTGVQRDGSAMVSRYLETTFNVAKNLADIVADATQVTAAQLNTADYVLIGGITNNAGYDDVYDAVTNTAGYPAGQVYYTNGMTGNIAAQYGVVMNSVDNAQNFGRILGYIYPEYLDQSDFIEYYFEHFYHIATASLPTVLVNALGTNLGSGLGVQNVNSHTWSWSASDFANYNEIATQALIDEGYAYWISLH